MARNQFERAAVLLRATADSYWRMIDATPPGEVRDALEALHAVLTTTADCAEVASVGGLRGIVRLAECVAGFYGPALEAVASECVVVGPNTDEQEGE
jgi:hypothetical protein